MEADGDWLSLNLSSSPATAASFVSRLGLSPLRTDLLVGLGKERGLLMPLAFCWQLETSQRAAWVPGRPQMQDLWGWEEISLAV